MGLREFFGRPPQPTTREEGDRALERLNKAKSEEMDVLKHDERIKLEELATGRGGIRSYGHLHDLSETKSDTKKAQKALDKVTGRAKAEAAKIWVSLEDLSHNLFRADVARPGSREMNGVLQKATYLEVGESFEQDVPGGKKMTVTKRGENEFGYELS